MAVKQSKAVIQDAHDFYAWANANQSEISYQLITQEEYNDKSKETEKRKNEMKPIKGTMSVHAITSEGRPNLLMRNTTYACQKCFSEQGFNSESSCKWDIVTLREVKQRNDTSNLSDTSKQASVDDKAKGSSGDSESNAKDSDGEGKDNVEVSDFVVAEYDGNCYIGQVLEVDKNDDSMYINFMTKSGKAIQRFKWPTKMDRIWVENNNVLRTKINAPKATGKGGRIFVVPDDILQFMEEKNELMKFAHA
jgi:hypothetical protein